MKVLDATSSTWLDITRATKKYHQLTIPHSNSKSAKVKLDIMDLQHVHKQLRQKSAYPIKIV